MVSVLPSFPAMRRDLTGFNFMDFRRVQIYSHLHPIQYIFSPKESSAPHGPSRIPQYLSSPLVEADLSDNSLFLEDSSIVRSGAEPDAGARHRNNQSLPTVPLSVGGSRPA